MKIPDLFNHLPPFTNEQSVTSDWCIFVYHFWLLCENHIILRLCSACSSVATAIFNNAKNLFSFWYFLIYSRCFWYSWYLPRGTRKWYFLWGWIHLLNLLHLQEGAKYFRLMTGNFLIFSNFHKICMFIVFKDLMEFFGGSSSEKWRKIALKFNFNVFFPNFV